MPIIDIELVSDDPADPLIMRGLADDLGRVFDAAPGKVWIRMRTLPVLSYAENGQPAPQPVFVTVLAGTPPAGEALRTQVEDITSTVARHTRRPAENIHVLYEPPARGRIAFGGRLVE